MKKIRLPASLERLHEVQGFVVQCAEKLGAPPTLAMKLELVLEELIVNIISYAYKNSEKQTSGKMEVTCGETEMQGERMLWVELRDWGVPFDPLQKSDPDTDANIDDRPIGGLGIHMVKEMTRDVTYSHVDGANVLTVFFPLEEGEVAGQGE